MRKYVQPAVESEEMLEQTSLACNVTALNDRAPECARLYRKSDDTRHLYGSLELGGSSSGGSQRQSVSSKIAPFHQLPTGTWLSGWNFDSSLPPCFVRLAFSQ
jgi:hypothetical protein